MVEPLDRTPRLGTVTRSSVVALPKGRAEGDARRVIGRWVRMKRSSWTGTSSYCSCCVPSSKSGGDGTMFEPLLDFW